VLAQHGATGLVLALDTPRAPAPLSIKRMDDLQKMTGPAWWDDTHTLISYNTLG